jgi:hypothetical protein
VIDFTHRQTITHSRSEDFMKVQLTRSLGHELAKAVGIEHAKAIEGSVHEVREENFPKLGGNAVVSESKSVKAGS